MSRSGDLLRRVAPVLFTLASITSFTSSATAQAHPDFSGKWVLDPTTVDAAMGPIGMTLTVSQGDKTIKVESAVTSSQMGDQKNTTTYNVDGSPSKNSVTTPAGPIEMVSTGAWDGQAFLITTKADIQGTPMEQSDRWSIDPGGKVLRLQRDVSVAGQNMSLTLAFNKQ